MMGKIVCPKARSLRNFFFLIADADKAISEAPLSVAGPDPAPAPPSLSLRAAEAVVMPVAGLELVVSRLALWLTVPPT